MTKLETYLAQVKARAEKATPGPWCGIDFLTNGPNTSEGPGLTIHLRPLDAGTALLCHTTDLTEDDQKFIAHSRTDIEKLLAIIEVYRSALDHYSKLQDWDLLPSVAIDAIAKGEEIAGRG